MSIKLLICNTSRSIQGGVENIVADLSRNLSVHGIETVVGLTKGIHHNLPERYRQTFPDLPSVVIDGTRGTRQARTEGLFKAIRQVRPDIVLITRVFDAYEVVSRLKIHNPRLRLAVTIQAFEPHYIYDAWLFRDHIDLCVTSGEMLRKVVCNWAGLAQDRVVNIPGGVWPPRCSIDDRQVSDPVRLGYVGRFDPNQKRALDLIPFVRALEKTRLRFTLMIVGSGPAEGVLRSAFATHVVSGVVHFIEWSTRDTLYRDVYPNLDIFLHFAHTEGVTIAPREAMAHGVVPVVSDFVGRGEEGQFISGRNALIFPVGDVEAAVQQVVKLIKAPELYRSLSSEARSSQQGKYSYHGAVEAWAQAIHECIAKPQATGVVVKPAYTPDGRLARWGIPAWLAQRMRNVVGKRHEHADGGGEWPTGSGTMTSCAEKEIIKYAMGQIKD